MALVLLFASTSLPAAVTNVYEWSFDGGRLTPALGGGSLAFADAATATVTTFGQAGSGGVPAIGGASGSFMHVPVFNAKSNGYLVNLSQTSSNGGGLYINQYTLIMDVLVPAPLNWTALFNTDPGNANDADWYVAPDGSIGISALGYTAAGIFAPDTWHRLAFTADLGAGLAAYYLDGAPVFQRAGASLLDGRYSLYSTNDNLPSLLLCNEGDLGGNYTHELYLAGLAVIDRALPAAEIALLGGPHPEGIYARHLRIERSGTNLVINWNGAPNLRLQRATTLSPSDWQNAPATLGASNYTETLLNWDTRYYRLLWQ